MSLTCSISAEFHFRNEIEQCPYETSIVVEKQITLHYKPLDYMAFAVC